MDTDGRSKYARPIHMMKTAVGRQKEKREETQIVEDKEETKYISDKNGKL